LPPGEYQATDPRILLIASANRTPSPPNQAMKMDVE
jgi:hypothetical protein